MDDPVKRIQPHSIEAEQSVIGAMLMNKDAILTASEILVREDFYAKQYGLLFEAMTELYNDGKAVDVVTLQDKLKEMGAPDEISEMDYLKEALNMVPLSPNVKQYADIVKGKSLMRRLIGINEEIANACYNGSTPVDEILEETEKKVFDIVQKRNTGDFVPIRDVVLNALDQINKASQMQGNVTGLASGFTDLDSKTAGFQPSDLILIAARPSMGKTAFVLNVAEHICFRLLKSAALFSLEMSKEQLVNRLLSLESRVNSQHIRTGELEDREWDGLMEGANIIASSKLIIDDTPGISISELRSRCRKYKLEHDVQIIIIDYLRR